MEAKDTSLIGMVVGAICLFIAFGVCTYKLLVNDFTLTMDQALAYITMGASVGIPFCPIYISTWLDKIAQIKHGFIETQNGTEVTNDAQ